MATGPRGSIKAGRTSPPAAHRARAPSPSPTPTHRPAPGAGPRSPAAAAAPSSTFLQGPTDASPGQAPSARDVTVRVHAVVRALAPMLGLDPARVPVTLLAGPGPAHGHARADGLVLT